MLKPIKDFHSTPSIATKLLALHDIWNHFIQTCARVSYWTPTGQQTCCPRLGPEAVVIWIVILGTKLSNYRSTLSTWSIISTWSHKAQVLLSSIFWQCLMSVVQHLPCSASEQNILHFVATLVIQRTLAPGCDRERRSYTLRPSSK
jgi:hypothetical protein